MRKKKLYFLLCLVLLGCITVAGWKVAALALEYRAGEKAYEDMKELSRPGTTAEGAPDEEPLTRDFDALQAINPDIVAWITVPGTKIDYPVVQGKDNQAYLNRLITGEWNSSGSIFLDYRSEPDFSDPYSMIYGHNMINGTMFFGLMQYKDQSFFREHPSGVLETPDGTYTIRFFAGFAAHAEDDVWDMELAAEEMEDWGAQMQKRSYFSSDILPAANERVVALATCSYEFNNARFLLLGILENASDK